MTRARKNGILVNLNYNDLKNKPLEFPPEAHTHAIVDVDGLQLALDGKADANHNHDGDYDPAGTAASEVASHESTHDHTKLHSHANKADLDAYNPANFEPADPEIQSHIGDTVGNPHSIDKNDVGLGNVTNEAQIPLSQKGSANGVAELDSGGKVPSNQLPSFVDDVLEYTSMSGFPATGENGKIYIAQDTNKTYRWSGTNYAEISQSLALGETSSTAYRGDRGKTAYDHSQTAHAPSDADNTQSAINDGASKTTPSDNDLFGFLDSAASYALKKFTWSNLKAALKTYFDTLYNYFSGSYNDLSDVPATFPPESHTHDSRYYTESEIDTKLSGKSDTSHSHSDLHSHANKADLDNYDPANFVSKTGDIISGDLDVNGSFFTSEPAFGGFPLAPNLIHNSYMNREINGVPTGFSDYGGLLTIETVSPFAKGFEGRYVSTDYYNSNPSQFVNDPELATDDGSLTYWYGNYNKGPRIQRGGLGDGWHDYSGGKLLKVSATGIVSGTDHCAILMPKEERNLGANWIFTAWVKIVKGDSFCVGSDAGYRSTRRASYVTKANADNGPQGWYRFVALIGTSQITRIDSLAISMAIIPDGNGDIEGYIALPYLANVTYKGTNQDSWTGSILDKLADQGLYINPSTKAIESDSESLKLNNNQVWHSGNFAPASKADSGHNHSGTYEPVFSKNNAFNKNFGTASNTVCQGNDSRLSDARTPTDDSVSYTKVDSTLKSQQSLSSGAINLAAGGGGKITLAANTAFSFSGFQLHKSYLLEVTANGFTPSFADLAKHKMVTGNAAFDTVSTFFINLVCVDATPGSEKLLTTIMKEA